MYTGIYVSKDVKICGYFSKLKGAWEKMFWKHRFNVLQSGVQVYFLFSLQIRNNEIT